MSLNNIVKVDYGKLVSITDASGRDCAKEEERKFMGRSGLLLHLVSADYPGDTFFKFYASEPTDLLSKEVLTTEIGRLSKSRKRDTYSLRTRLQETYTFHNEYDLTPDEKFFLRIRAGLEK